MSAFGWGFCVAWTCYVTPASVRRTLPGPHMALSPNPPLPVGDDPDAPATRLAPMLLEVLALCGYGLWMLLGLALALGIYSPGRGDALVPLGLGCAFVSAGLLATCLRLPPVPEWHGWRIGRAQRPTREAMLALATYLPMLGLAGMVRGDEQFWATRLLGGLLGLGSLVCLITSAYGYRTRRLADQAGLAAQLPISRLLSAAYGGGLWLWVCLVFQADLADALPYGRWTITLLLLAMLLGLVDGVGWHSLRGERLGERRPAAPPGLQSRRFLAAALMCGVPCLSLVLAPLLPGGHWLAVGGAAAYIVGKSLELWLYDVALTRFALTRSPEHLPGRWDSGY